MSKYYVQSIDQVMAPAPAQGGRDCTSAKLPRARLDTLPHELLVKILRRAVVATDQPVFVNDAHHRDTLNEAATEAAAHFATQPNLVAPSPKLGVLLVSKVLYFAGIEAYFGSSTFQFGNVENFKSFVMALGPDRKGHVRSLVLQIQPRHDLPRYKFQKDLFWGQGALSRSDFEPFTSLQRMDVKVWKNGCGGTKGPMYTEDEMAAAQRFVDRSWGLSGVEVVYPWT